jgi:hypothetical protein
MCCLLEIWDRRVMMEVLCWPVIKVRDMWRGYSDADIRSMRVKLMSGQNDFTHREHTAYVCEVQQDQDREVL